MNIDWNKPVGKICGPSTIPGARYVQNGLHFNGAGECVDDVQEESLDDTKTQANGIEEEIEDIETQAKKLVESGLTHTEIGKRLGVPRQKITAMVR